VSKRFLLAIALSLGFLGLYVLTSSRTVILHHDDAAEFQTIGVIGGVPHQPYPLWCLIAKSFALLPIGEPAFRITLLSIVFGCVTIAFLFHFVIRITSDAAAAAAAAVVLGLSMTFWRNAVVAEVYTMNTFLFVSLLIAAVRWLTTHSRRDWLLFMFTLGLLISHHQVNIALLPAIALAAAWHREEIRRHVPATFLVAGAVIFLIPFSLYLYTYVIDRLSTPMNWYDNYGKYLYAAAGNDPGAFENFFERIRFQMFVGRLGPFLPTAGEFVSRLAVWLRNVFSFELPVAASLLAVGGFLFTCRIKWRVAVLALAAAFPTVFLALVVGGGVTRDVYSLAVLTLLAILAGVCTARLRGYRRRWHIGSHALPIMVLVLVFLFPYLQLSFSPGRLNWLAGDNASKYFHHLQASNDDGRTLANSAAETIPRGSLVFAEWSESNVLKYAKLVAGDLDGIEVSYVLPKKEYMMDVIADKKPLHLFFTAAPEDYGFETSRAIPLLTGFQLYRVEVPAVGGR
jgi:hypothetical protein